MTEKELEIVIAGHEMPRLELKEAFGVRAIGKRGRAPSRKGLRTAAPAEEVVDGTEALE